MTSNRTEALNPRDAVAVCLDGMLVACAHAAGWAFGRFGNVREIVPGQAFRSAQLTPAQLERQIHDRGLRAVISLRGGHKRNAWFRNEKAVCERNGILFRSVCLRATTLPPADQLAKLVRWLDEAPRPLMMHCRAGADRSGLASAVYLSLYEGMDPEAARRQQLSWRYGHVSRGPGRAMHEFFRLYAQTHDGLTLRQWIQDRYPDVRPDA
jgi:protein tyrosine/serine phosphatase